MQDQVSKDLRLISLFSGCGGLDLGFEGGFETLHSSIAPRPDLIARHINDRYVELKPTRFQLLFSNDILPAARSAWMQNFQRYGYPSHVFRGESIVDLVRKEEQGRTVFPEKVDIVIGGFPCQDFSVAGKRRGFRSSRNHQGEKIDDPSVPSVETRGMLYYWMKRVIDITLPKVFVAENVKGLVNLGEVKEIIRSDFASAGTEGYYVFPPRVLHAGNYGVSQTRERVFFIGILRDALQPDILKQLEKNESTPPSLDPYPTPTHTIGNEETLAPFVPLREVLHGLPEPEQSNDPAQQKYSRAKYMGAHCQGQREVQLDRMAPTIRAEHHGNIEFRRLSVENGGNQHEELKRGLRERRLTPRECALIQSFPPSFDVVHPSPGEKLPAVSTSSAYRLIGNAVPPLLGYHIAKRIEELWETYFG